MDTAQVNVLDVGESRGILQQVDGLGSNPSSVGEDGRRYKPDRGFRKATCKSIHGKDFLIHHDRVYETLPPARCIFHLSQFRSLQHFADWGKSILGDGFSGLLTAPLSRFDCCINIAGIPHETLASALVVKRLRQQNNRGRASAPDYQRYGDKPFQIVLYNRELPECGLDYVAPDVHPSSVEFCSRLEARHWNEKTPIRSLSEIGRLREINPFAYAEFVSEGDILVREPKEFKLLYAYLYLKNQVGAHEAKRQFSDNRNFHRDIAPYLGQLNLDLHELWRKRVDRFLGEGQA